MTDIENPISKDDFINIYLKNNIEIWKNELPIQCNMYIKQEGAGNGKTYGIIQMLENDTMYHYNNFIYITKQHSAKTVIYKEFNDQIKEKQLNYIINVNGYENNKKYIIEFFNTKFNKQCKIIIATVDSLMYSIGNKNHTYLDKFEGLILSIFKDEYIDCYDNGKIIYAGINPKLNKETLLIIDETQDLTIDYAKALCSIMRDRYIDIYIVGDKLQSISFENNAFVYLSENEFESINKIKFEPKNICRRFTHPILVDFVNSMIPFDNYNLPSIVPYKTDIDNLINEPLIIFTDDKSINCDNKEDKNKVKINLAIEQIMEKFNNEVKLFHRIPEDFLIITPFTKNNPLVESLELTINIYWKNKFSEIDYIQNVLNNDEYWKGEIYTTIDWKEYNKQLIEKNIIIIKLTEKGIDYINYFEIIYNCMINIITKLKKNLKNNNIPLFCPYESIILLHMIEIIKNKNLEKEKPKEIPKKKPITTLNIMDIYNITDIYSNTFEKDIKGHENCLCNECFINKKINANINKNDSLKNYILSHYEKINNIKEYLTVLYETYPNINWLFKHPIKYNSVNQSFKINQSYNLIGYDDKNVIIGYIKPQFNDINYNEILKNSIFDIYLLKNVNKSNDRQQVESNNYMRFNNKNIIISVFSIDLKTPYYIKFIDKDNNDLIDDNISEIKTMIYE